MSSEDHITCCCLQRGGLLREMANEKEREKNYRLKLGWKTFTTPLLEKHSVQIKQAPVCAECDDRFGGTFPSLCLFLIFLAFCHLVCAKLVVLFGAVISPSFICNLPLVFFLSLYVSLSFSLVMSLSRRESLGYQCSASDRKRLINKLSCFSSPLYPPPFFLKRGLLLLSTTFLLIPPPTPLLIIPPSLLFFPVVDGRESQVCDNNYTYTQKKIMSFPPFNKFAVK